MAQPSFLLDRRCEYRTTSNQKVIVTELPETRVSFRGHLTDSSSHGLGLRLVLPLEAGTNISVEWNDTIVLGQIVHCCKSDGKYHAGLRTEYIILDRTQSRHSTPASEESRQQGGRGVV